MKCARVGATELLLVSLWVWSASAQAPEPTKGPIPPRADGVLQLDASAATVHGNTARFEVLQGIGNLCYWTNPGDWVSWDLSLPQAVDFVVELKYSCQAGSQGSEFDVTIGDQKIANRILADTGTWYDHQLMKLGNLRVAQPGRQTLSLKPTKKPGTAVMNLVWLRLIPAGDYPSYLARTAAERTIQPIPLPARVFVVPNFHPASCGWLANWSVERNYCANSYLDHLDRVRDDANYAFAMSECNNMLAIRNFQPERFAELKQRVAEGRVELVNAFFLEPTINLSGGEALAKMGIEGLRWQQQVMGVRPRFAWTIDVCGTHAQMPQLCAELGLDALIYTRCNRSAKSVFWSESPDGSRLLTLVPGHYSDDIGGAYATRETLSQAQLRQAAKAISAKLAITPAGAPVLILGGHGDYALAPARHENPTEFLQQWKQTYPECQIRYSGLGAYVDALRPGLDSGKLQLPTVTTGTSYTFDSFWIECPRVKCWYRRDEHALQSAEILATIASLSSSFDYPVQSFYHAWLQMLLNMDRNTLWGSAGGMVFEHPSSWDAKDRFEWVQQHSAAILHAAARHLPREGQMALLFNAANWNRTDPLRLKLTEHSGLGDLACEAAEDGSVFYEDQLPACGIITLEINTNAPPPPHQIPLPPKVETQWYTARIDPTNGALVSLKSKPSGREMLGGPANVIVAEKHTGQGDPGDFTDARPKRPRLGSSSDSPTTVTATEGPVTITTMAQGEFVGGGQIKRRTRFFKHSPRIEFETELNDIPNLTVVVAEFPLAETPAEIRRGIPFGFSRDDGVVSGIVPAVRWSDYASPGRGGVALLDRGLSGREINDRTAVIYLLNATDKYYGYTNAWLSGRGQHRLEYALVAHEADWPTAGVPRLAWEYNCPVTLTTGCLSHPPSSFVRTSDNVILEALRRDGSDIEIRLVESLGLAGNAEVTLFLPHVDAHLTDLTGGHARQLEDRRDTPAGNHYRFPVRPQQIVTLRFHTEKPVAEIEPLLEWDELVPPQKRAALHEYLKDKKGHPPRGS